MISTKPIGPVVCPRNPVLIKTEFRGTGTPGEWEVELASDDHGETIVWKSNGIEGTDRVRVDVNSGRFLSQLADRDRLEPSTIYFARVRERDSVGEWSLWSDWHQPFQTEETSARVGLWKIIGANKVVSLESN